MRLGVVFPHTEIGCAPEVTASFAQASEDLGYDYLTVFDHVLGAEFSDRDPPLHGLWDESSMFHDPFVLFGYLAGVTSRIEFVTGILVLPQRQTALVAKQAAVVDVLSHGRLRLGVGVGWNYVEFEGLGADFHDRGRRLEEQVNVIRKLWTEPVVNYRGVDHRLDRVGIRPLPDRSIPVWFGGFRDDALQRAARIGDGFIVAGPAADVSGRVAQLHQMLESNGRDPRDFGIDVIEQYQPDLRKLEHSIRERIRVGATHLTLRTLGAGLDTAEAHLDAMESCTQVFRRITAY